MDIIEKIDLEKVNWQSSREFFDSLRGELEKLDDRTESYDFTWVGKRKSIIEAGAPVNKILRPDVEASKDFDNTKNMLIVGDNLDALKILQESYLGQVKMIYIDPPYNTGHDFVYRDNFTTKKDDYDDSSISEDGERFISEDEFIENSKSNGRFHSDWLSMIYPRLKLARNLLSDDGVIFISIDDNEQANLKKVCDEIFGEENKIAEFVVVRAEGGGLAKQVVKGHDYLFAYAKNISIFTPLGRPKDIRGKIVERDGEQFWIQEDWLRKEFGKYGNCYYEEVMQYKGEVVKQEIDKKIEAGDYILIPKDNGLHIVGKLRNIKDDASKFYSILKHPSANGIKDLDSLKMGGYFDYSKPLSLLKETVLGATFFDKNGGSLILDFFAGSGTTGHAVMDLNAEDGGNRRYILVQLPEKTNEKSEARKAGYETIDQITAERLRRAGEKVQKEHPGAKVDTGFRVFHINDSNEKENIRKPLEEYTQETMLDMVDNLKPDRTPLDLLFGAVYASALPFDLHLETRKIGDNNTVYLYGYLGESSGLVACFDDNISDDTIKEVAKLKPLAAVFKDSSFANSAAKINLSEHFRILSVDTKVKVI